MSPFQRLEVALMQTLAVAGLSDTVYCFHCDSNADGAHADGGGFERALNVLQIEHERSGTYPAIAVFGLLSGPTNLSSPLTLGWRELFHWPGFIYLPYGFTKEELLANARCIIEGAKTPLPPGLLPAVGDVRCSAFEVRHWLENRRRNVEAALRNVTRAMNRELELDASYLEPVSAISDEHRAMLDRLWALEGVAKRFAPKNCGLAAVMEAVKVFEADWQTLEVRRVALRQTEESEWASCLCEFAQAHRQVSDALTSAIVAISELDNEMNSQEQQEH